MDYYYIRIKTGFSVDLLLCKINWKKVNKNDFQTDFKNWKKLVKINVQRLRLNNKSFL